MKTKKQRRVLSPELADWYKILKGFASSGSFLFEDDSGLRNIKKVKLARDSNEIPKGFIFRC